MVLHPDFSNYRYLFVVYNYQGSSGTEERLVRLTYDNGVLGSPVTLLEGIDGAGDHNGLRLVITNEAYSNFHGTTFISPCLQCAG